MSRILSLFSVFPVLLVSVNAWAEEYADYDPQAAQDQVSAPLFVVIAYGAIWALVLYFAVALWRRQQALQKELAAANARLDALSTDAGQSGRAEP